MKRIFSVPAAAAKPLLNRIKRLLKMKTASDRRSDCLAGAIVVLLLVALPAWGLLSNSGSSPHNLPTAFAQNFEGMPAPAAHEQTPKLYFLGELKEVIPPQHLIGFLEERFPGVVCMPLSDNSGVLASATQEVHEQLAEVLDKLKHQLSEHLNRKKEEEKPARASLPGSDDAIPTANALPQYYSPAPISAAPPVDPSAPTAYQNPDFVTAAIVLKSRDPREYYEILTAWLKGEDGSKANAIKLDPINNILIVTDEPSFIDVIREMTLKYDAMETEYPYENLADFMAKNETMQVYTYNVKSFSSKSLCHFLRSMIFSSLGVEGTDRVAFFADPPSNKIIFATNCIIENHFLKIITNFLNHCSQLGEPGSYASPPGTYQLAEPPSPIFGEQLRNVPSFPTGESPEGESLNTVEIYPIGDLATDKKTGNFSQENLAALDRLIKEQFGLPPVVIGFDHRSYSLIISAPEDIHQRIAAFLEQLRAFVGTNSPQEEVEKFSEVTPALENPVVSPDLAEVKTLEEYNVEKVLEKKISLDVTEMPLGELLDLIEKESSAKQITVDAAAINDTGTTAECLIRDTAVTFRCVDLPLAKALERLLRPLNLTFTVDEGDVLITTPEEEMHTFQVCIYSTDCEEWVIMPAALAELIKENIDPFVWYETGSIRAKVTPMGDKKIMINAPYQVRRKVKAFLDEMRQKHLPE